MLGKLVTQTQNNFPVVSQTEEMEPLIKKRPCDYENIFINSI